MPRASNRRPPVIALLTDFGLSDHYVGAMKGIIVQRLPDARIIDITHDIEPGHIRRGAYSLWAAAPSLPEGAVVVAVVDPGVGTDRAIMILKTRRHVFVAPDNGLLDLIRSDEPKAAMYVPGPGIWPRSLAPTHHPPFTAATYLPRWQQPWVAE